MSNIITRLGSITDRLIIQVTALVVSIRPLALVATVGLGLLLKFVPPDGMVRPGFLLFLGRFHPLVVHLPIAFVLLLPAFEVPLPFLARSARRGASALLSFSAIVTLLGAILFGWLLAYSGGFQGTLLMQHAWAAVITGTLLSLSVLLWNRELPRIALILAAVASVSLTGHLGGELTHGTNYLTEYAPEPIKSLISGESNTAPIKGDMTVYAAVLAPAFNRSCVQCHNPGTANGGLDLSSLKGLMKGGQDGPAIAPGKPIESLLVKRICLAPDDQKAMPPAPKQPLTSAELSILRAWINSGAKSDTEIGDLSGLPSEGKNLVSSRRRALRPPPPEVADPTKAMPKILAAAKEAGISIVPLSSNPKEGLLLQTYGKGAQIDDSKFALITPAATFLVETELADTKITDRSLETISSFSNLLKLDLSRTAVTGVGISKILTLPHLEVLILTGTSLDDAWLKGVHPGPSLQTLGLFQTKVTEGAIEAFKKLNPKLTLYGPIKVVPPPVQTSPTPVKPAPAPTTQETLLEKQMQMLSEGMKQLSVLVADPAKHADTVTLLEAQKMRALDAKTMDPIKAASIPPADKDKFLTEYRAQLDKLAATFASIEEAVKGGKYDQAKTLLATVGDIRKAGHTKFKAEAPMPPKPAPSVPTLAPSALSTAHANPTAQKPTAPIAAPTPATPLNTGCPYSKKPVVESTVIEVNGRKIAFCCQDCRKKFLDHPETQSEVLKTLAPTANLTPSPTPTPTAAVPLNTLCPYSKKPVVESTVIEVDGRKIAFCCQDCRKKFLDHPETQSEVIKTIYP